MIPWLLLTLLLQTRPTPPTSTGPQMSAAAAITDAQNLLDAEGRKMVEKAVAEFQSRSRRTLAVELLAQVPATQKELAAAPGLPTALQQWAESRFIALPHADFLLVYCRDPLGLIIAASPRVTEARFPRHRFEEIDKNVQSRLEKNSPAEAVVHAIHLLRDYFGQAATPGRMRIRILPPTPPLPPELQAQVDQMVAARKAEPLSNLLWLLWFLAAAVGVWLIWSSVRYYELRRESTATSIRSDGFVAVSQSPTVGGPSSRFGSPLTLWLRALFGDGMGVSLSDRFLRRELPGAPTTRDAPGEQSNLVP